MMISFHTACPPQSEELVCRGGASTASLNSESEAEYLVRVSGQSGVSGAFTLGIGT